MHPRLLPDESEIQAVRNRIGQHLPPTPLLPLELDVPGTTVSVKLENLQPVGSFKIRGALNAMLALAEAGPTPPGVYTISAGNMGQAVAWSARRLGLPAVVVVPESAPQAKVDAITALGAEVVELPWDDLWSAMVNREYPPLGRYHFVHPFEDRDVIAGNATIGIELVEQAAGVPDAVVVPVGGGGLLTGIAAGVRLRSGTTRVYAAECEAAAPLAAALRAGEPTTVTRRPSFVDGIGSARVTDAMWPLLQASVTASVVVSEQEIARAMRVLASRCQVVSEGAGAASVAAVASGSVAAGSVVAVVSGGRVDADRFAAVLRGGPDE